MLVRTTVSLEHTIRLKLLLKTCISRSSNGSNTRVDTIQAVKCPTHYLKKKLAENVEKYSFFGEILNI